ncbi:hypothetical protein OOT46_15775 [Aquabacterium sp. A7-Y]|uniref:hypothetical protein n=1 Tax=Aquabacterium sp. A7-Y TaxID=1349605 RepID=UPI00223DBEB8|nr:hypothetical protein [Aquabacterium sp. A7-Y]MCW7539303.1 hypothetical protein [Aquabacterium sp. A7-Y]
MTTTETARPRRLFAVFITALLAACGGGGDADGSTGVQPEDGTNTDGNTNTGTGTNAGRWVKIADEYGAFTVSGTQVVRYGLAPRWVQKTVRGSGQCTNAFFGSDPAKGAEKICERLAANTPPPSSPPPQPPSAGVRYGDLRAASLGPNASLNGAVPFPADNAWNQDVSSAPRDPRSDALIASIGLSTGLHNDFGSGTYQGAPIGIPYVVVSGSQPRVPITLGDYADESDPGPYPVPRNAPVEGGPSSSGDRHVLVIDRDNNRLYEMGNAYPNNDGSWRASGGSIFHLSGNLVRPTGQPGWTSADAAGLPIFPGLVRYDEASRGPGGIRHALRFTVQRTRRAYVPPATHWASSDTSPDLPPMGMRVRLKASYAIPPGFSPETKAILTALKTYGMFVADNGSNWFLSGAPDPRWNNERLKSELRQVKGGHFEVVRMDGLVAD